MGGNNKFIDKFSNVAMRVGGQIHLKALRDTFATIMPLYILAGVAVLINNVVLPFILKGNALVNAHTVLGYCHYKWYIKYLRITCGTNRRLYVITK